MMHYWWNVIYYNMYDVVCDLWMMIYEYMYWYATFINLLFNIFLNFLNMVYDIVWMIVIIYFDILYMLIYVM